MTVNVLPILHLAMYIGPEVMMPVATAIAAVVGYLLMFGRNTLALVKRMGAAVRRLVTKR